MLQGILRQKKTELDAKGNIVLNSDGTALVYNGEQILKDGYAEKQKAVLKNLSLLKQQSTTDEEKRLYNIFFNIIRNDYDTVHKFIG